MKSTLVFLLATLIGFCIVLLYNRFSYQPLGKTNKKQPTPVETSFSIEKPPQNSIKADIATFSGEVLWQSRVATQASLLTISRTLLQGEDIATGNTGSISMQFPNLGRVTLRPNTKVSLIQTLPTAIVLKQNSGSVLYEKRGSLPLSIQTLGLLVEQISGTMTITLKDLVTLSVINGSTKVAFEDEDNTTQVITITEGHKLEFDNDTKEAALSKR